MVVACNRYVAEDALVVIQEDYESLPAIVDVENALAPNAVCIHEGNKATWPAVELPVGETWRAPSAMRR